LKKYDNGNWNKIPFEPTRPGVKRAVFGMDAKDLLCTINEISFGHELWPHSHSNEQIGLVLQGECDYYVGGVPHRMTAGSWIVIPPDEEHYIMVTSQDVPVLNMDIFTPSRPEFIKAYKSFLESQNK
jgi:quercetin dioxygenase-like cupin family protein